MCMLPNIITVVNVFQEILALTTIRNTVTSKRVIVQTILYTETYF